MKAETISPVTKIHNNHADIYGRWRERIHRTCHSSSTSVENTEKDKIDPYWVLSHRRGKHLDLHREWKQCRRFFRHALKIPMEHGRAI